MSMESFELAQLEDEGRVETIASLAQDIAHRADELRKMVDELSTPFAGMIEEKTFEEIWKTNLKAGHSTTS
jgi:hypothetical protein